MAREYWATFSIYDHRADYYRPSLLLFDRVVMPVPTVPWRGLSDPRELEQLSAEVDWLEAQGCALRYDWDPERFAEWQADVLAVSTSRVIERRVAPAGGGGNVGDAQLDTRYQLQYLVEEGALRLPELHPADVTVMPVFAEKEAYLAASPERGGIDVDKQMTMELVLDEFPVAPPDTSLEDIVDLRESGFVQEQVGKLRAWQLEVVADLADFGDDVTRRRLRLERAEQDLKNAVADYRRAMSAHLGGERRARWITLFSLWNPIKFVERIGAEHGDEVTLRSQGERCWKALGGQKFAFAGVICTGQDIGR